MIVTIDIGGTKTLCACWQGREIVKEERFKTSEIDDLEVFVSEWARKYKADAVSLAAAGPVRGGSFSLTNGKGSISVKRLRERLTGVRRVLILNDIEALAYALPDLNAEQVRPLYEVSCDGFQGNFNNSEGKDENRNKNKSGNKNRNKNNAAHSDIDNSDAGGAKVIVSVGTGLGVAGVTRNGEVVPSEGGHMDFAPANDAQTRIYHALSERYGHVSYERLLSGSGIASIYETLYGEKVSPEWVTKAAESGDGAALRTIEEFTRILGAFCGNLALAFSAEGGIYLGGGIIPKIVSLIDVRKFTDGFTDKGRFHDRLEGVPVYTILDERAPSIGAAAAVNDLCERRL